MRGVVLAAGGVLAAVLYVGATAFEWDVANAAAWLGVVPWAGAALLADAAWATGAWDRSGEYEPLPASIFVIPFGVPAFAAAVVLGVAARRRVTAHRHR